MRSADIRMLCFATGLLGTVDVIIDVPGYFQ
jgi:hypothetical protein